MRLFIAVDLPDEVVAQARELCQGLAGAHWSNPAQLHLTLRFLGDVADDRVAALRADLERVRGAPFTLGLRGVGVFPRKRLPARVLWAGVVPAEPTAALKAAIDDVMGPDPEAAERGFSPHLTLARFRSDPGAALDHYLGQHAAFASATWTVDRFYLYRSTLGNEGARHEILQRYSLAGP
jgi:2'-5' RNA ligase